MANHTKDQISIQVKVGMLVVGHIQRGVFKKKIAGSKHMLHEPLAIAFADESLIQAEQFGTIKLEITDTETGRVYRADFSYFKKNCFALQRVGFEPQHAMRLEKWTIKGARRQHKADSTSSPPEPPTPGNKPGTVQLHLFSSGNG